MNTFIKMKSVYIMRICAKVDDSCLLYELKKAATAILDLVSERCNLVVAMKGFQGLNSTGIVVHGQQVLVGLQIGEVKS